jgi:hypothetical protein
MTVIGCPDTGTDYRWRGYAYVEQRSTSLPSSLRPEIKFKAG